MKLTIIYPYCMEEKLEVIKEPSIYCREDQVLFVPNDIVFEDMVKGSDYRRLKKIMKYNSSSFLKRLKFLFKGYSYETRRN